MFKRIVLFTFLISIIAVPSFAFLSSEFGPPILPASGIRYDVVSRSDHEVAELLEYNGPWFTTTVTILIETFPGDTLASLTQDINNHSCFDETKVEQQLLIDQNPELLFHMIDELDTIESGTMLLLTCDTPIRRFHHNGGLEHTL